MRAPVGNNSKISARSRFWASVSFGSASRSWSRSVASRGLGSRSGSLGTFDGGFEITGEPLFAGSPAESGNDHQHGVPEPPIGGRNSARQIGRRARRGTQSLQRLPQASRASRPGLPFLICSHLGYAVIGVPR